MATETVVRARIDAKVKREAYAVLAGMGISVSDAIRMLLHRVATERALPFDVRLPSSATLEALEEADRGNLPAFDSVAALMADLNDPDEGN